MTQKYQYEDIKENNLSERRESGERGKSTRAKIEEIGNKNINYNISSKNEHR